MWVITKDLIDEGRNVGRGSHDLPENPQCGKNHELKYRFRLSDDDGEVYYEGYSSVNDDEDAFAPLDDFAEGYAGCPTIEYYNYDEKRWEML